MACRQDKFLFRYLAADFPIFIIFEQFKLLISEYFVVDKS